MAMYGALRGWDDEDHYDDYDECDDDIYQSMRAALNETAFSTSERMMSSLSRVAQLNAAIAAEATDNSAEAAKVKKSHKRSGRKISRKTTPLSAVSSNKLHTTVFPNMRVPVTMPKKNGKKGRVGYNSGRGLTSDGKPESVPVMSIQCPMPGAITVTTEATAVKKVVWGPFERVEASGEAKSLVKELFSAIDAVEKAKRKRNGESSDGESESDAVGEPIKPLVEKDTTIPTAKEEEEATVPNTFSSEDTTPADTVSYTENESTSDILGQQPRGGHGAPPPTPPEAIFVRKTSAAAAMSMPTLPYSIHHSADFKLVEQFRAEYVTDPEAFENETLDIKQGLIESKVKRGGSPILLVEEYTVELASREGAETAEKWARGQTKSREHPGLRSRAGSLKSQPSSGTLKMRGVGEGSKDAGLFPALARSKIEKAEEAEKTTTGDVAGPSSAEIEHDTAIPSLELTPPALENKPTASKSTIKKVKKSAAKAEKKTLKLTVRKVDKALSELNLAKHVAKVSTHGLVRHQSSTKREVSDHGERRTVKTWIEVTEVYDVPSVKRLTTNDVFAAVAQEHEDKEAEGWESDTSDEDDADEKAIGRAKKGKAKAKKTPSGHSTSSDSSSSDSDSDFDTDSDSDDEDDEGGNEAEIGGLLSSLSRFKGGIDADSIARFGNDLGAIIAGLGGENMLRFSEE